RHVDRLCPAGASTAVGRYTGHTLGRRLRTGAPVGAAYVVSGTAMNIFDAYQRRLTGAIERLVAAGKLPEGLDLSRVVVEPPRDPAHGDLATNAAMVLAKPAGTNPRALAALIAGELEKEEGVTAVEIAGPGFINLRLAPTVYQEVLRAVATLGTDFGRGAPKKGKPINVEYVSANPTGPMHVGHGRG